MFDPTRRVYLLDGAFGTQIINRKIAMGAEGSVGVLLSHPSVVKEIHLEYITAGADVITTNTFSANKLKLNKLGRSDEFEKLNQLAVKLARDAVEESGKQVLIAGSISPLGELIEPYGNLSFREAIAMHAEHARVLADAGVDLFLLETHFFLGECKAAAIAALETGLPVVASMTFEQGGHTLTGADAEVVVAVLEPLGITALTTNCGLGPNELNSVVEDYCRYAKIPVGIFANAGLPETVCGDDIYPMHPDEFAEWAVKYESMGCNVIGGCCGTTPQHIKALKDKLTFKPVERTVERNGWIAASTFRAIRSWKSQFTRIGEKLNSTANKTIKQKFINQNIDELVEIAREQVITGSDILDINASVNDDQGEFMGTLVQEINKLLKWPVSLDSPNPKEIEKVLSNYAGKALINSTTAQPERMEIIFKLAKRYGASVIGLCMTEGKEGIDHDFEGRWQKIQTIIDYAKSVGFPLQDLFIDPLVMPAGAVTEGPRLTLEIIRKCSKLGIKTAIGASNVSFGLPMREIFNATFIAQAVEAGVSAVIIDTTSDVTRKIVAAAEILAGRRKLDKQLKNVFISSESKTKENTTEVQNLKSLIYDGEQNKAINLTSELLKTIDPRSILDNQIISALNDAGEAFGRKELYLPELLLIAQTAKKCINILEPELMRAVSSNGDSSRKKRIVIGTVRGDVHDIGKNILALMLSNQGYQVTDLGVDVSKEKFLTKSIEINADIIAMSALMTTTANYMKEVGVYLAENNCEIPMAIGGAIVSPKLVKEIGAIGYAKDAVSAIKLFDEYFGYEKVKSTETMLEQPITTAERLERRLITTSPAIPFKNNAAASISKEFITTSAPSYKFGEEVTELSGQVGYVLAKWVKLISIISDNDKESQTDNLLKKR